MPRPAPRALLAAASLVLAAAGLTSACEGPPPGSGPDAGAQPPTTPPADTGEPVPDAGTAVNAPRYEHYIRRQPYPRLVLEVDGLGGYTPTPSVVTRLKSGLLSVLDKESVEVRFDRAYEGRGAGHAWTDVELLQLAEATFDLRVEPGTIKLHVLLVDGHSAHDSGGGRVLGLAFPWTHLVLFRQTLDSACGATPVLRSQACLDAEYGVWAHEVGHQLGLVDNGLPMVTDHRDAAHGAHDTSDACTMYWAYESDDILTAVSKGLFGDAPNLGLDAACLADLEAVKSRP